MDYLPIFFIVRNRPCLVVGGGEVAARKVALLQQAGGRIKVVSPELSVSLEKALSAGEIDYRAGPFLPDDLDDCELVVAATDNPLINREVSQLCRARILPVNVVDQPELCSFIMPAIIDRSPILIAVSTGGASPVLARLLRGRLESLIPAAYGRLAALAASFREKVQQNIPAPQRRLFWERVLQGPIAEMVLSGREKSAQRALMAALEQGSETTTSTGEVYLVGGGPGDPDLLTFRALRLMQQADIVIYDRLISPVVLDKVRRDAKRIFAGKKRSDHVLPQEEINQLLVRLAKQGQRVLRLKGGDPFIFGRGGEEIETLTREGIPFQVVPGITAASGCSAYAGIPLTHRDYAQSCTFVTGHAKQGDLKLNWESLAQPQQTVVFYMGLESVELICSRLIEHGLPATMPAAMIEQGTTPEQRVYTATLATLPGEVGKANVRSPSLLIIGEVVKLRGDMAWFESNYG